MLEVAISYSDIVNFKRLELEDILTSKGFDLSGIIKTIDDVENLQIIFKQEAI